MNEITRIHIAKVAYDIEVTAKKDLEKYIKSLETYTQDAEVLTDIEIRMTELLANRKVTAGSVISADDVADVRAQLGEPYEFADEDGDIAVGATPNSEATHRLYRSIDDAVLGGVMSGMAAFFKVNPLWTRLIFILVTFISFGFALFVYIILWIIIPAARTAAQKLQLAGVPVTVESIRELNSAAEANPPRSIAPTIRRGAAIGTGVVGIIAAVSTAALTVWGVVEVFAQNRMGDLSESFLRNGVEYAWVPWLLFWIVLVGMLLLTALFSLISYALLAQKLTKKMLVTGIVVIVLGVVSVVSVFSIIATQTWRIQSEAQSATKSLKLNLPKEFSAVQSVVIESPTDTTPDNGSFIAAISTVQYVVDAGAPRYELTALPNAKVAVKIDQGTTAHITLDVPEDYRNSYVQPSLIIYGPALSTVETNGIRLTYSNADTQDALKVKLSKASNTVTVNGTFQTVSVEGKGSVDLNSSSIQALTIRAEQNLTVIAGTVRTLNTTQPDVCPGLGYRETTSSVSVSGITSGTMTYNGKEVPAASRTSSCATVSVGNDDSRE